MTIGQPETSLLQEKPAVNPGLPEISSSGQKPMIHHKAQENVDRLIVSYSNRSDWRRYGVSSSRRLVSLPVYIRRFDQIREFLRTVLGFTPAEREVALRLLRLWAYYGLVYPKASQITQDPGCSKATYWRTVRRLKEMGLVQVVNRYVVRPHAQISNLYRLDRLALVLARYLAERGARFREEWFRPYLAREGRSFWAWAFQGPVATTGPP